MRPRHDARLIPAALAAYGASAAVGLRVVEPRVLVLAGLSVAVLLARGPRRAGASAWLAALAFAAASFAAGIRLDAALTGGFGEALAAGVPATFSGVVASDPREIAPGPFALGQERWLLSIDVDGVSLPGQPPAPARAPVTVVGAKEWSEVEVGDRVEATGRLSPTGPGRAVAIVWDGELTGIAPAAGVSKTVGDLRAGLRRAASDLPDDLRALTIGMTIGDTSGMPAAQVREMRIAGLTHLTAVSGAQFALLALAIGAGARALGWGRAIRVVLLCAVVLGFVILVRPEPSVIRAAWMGVVGAVALAWGRPSQALPALATGVIGLLLADPSLALSYGFALSVAATAGIVLWAPVVASSLARFLPGGAAKVLAVPIAAQVVCTPILVLLAPGIGPYAVVANLVAVPFAAVVTALGLLATAVAPLSATAAEALAWAASVAARPVAWAAHVAAGLPGSWLPWPPGLLGACLAAAVGAALIAATTARRVTGWARLGALVAVLAVVAASPPVRATLAEASRRAPSDWAIAVCDVGQGDMTLLRAGPTSAVVVDVGPDGTTALACLSRHGVSNVPLLVLTHPHADHDGGLGAVLSATDVDQAWVSLPGAVAARERGPLTAGRVPFSVPSPGTQVRVGEVVVTAWRAGDAGARTDSEVNDSSVVLAGQADGVTFLALGDLEADGQRALARGIIPPVIDVLKVAHHGSAGQDDAFLTSLSVGLAVISVGADNPYGHPAQRTLDLLAPIASGVVRTDQCGDIDVSNRAGVVVTAGCPRSVGGLGHGNDWHAADGVVDGCRPGTSRARVRSRGDSRWPRRREDCRRGAAEGRCCCRDHAGGGRVLARGPPCGDKPVALRGTWSGCGAGSGVDDG